MPRAECIAHWTKVLNSFVERGIEFLTPSELDAVVEQGEDEEDVLDARIQKSLLILVKGRLDANPELNHQFRETTDWKVLNQILTLARVRELTRTVALKKNQASGIRYDVRGLSQTFYGRKILHGLGFTSKSKLLTQDEFELVKLEFAKIKLTVPVAESLPRQSRRPKQVKTVFISHANHDRKTANTICETLESHGFRSWIAPRDVVPGATWAGSISDAISKSSVMVVVFSRHANDSPQVLREVTLADKARLTVIPFRIDESPLSKDFEYYLGTLHWLDATIPPIDDHISSLSEFVSAHIKLASPS